MQAKEYQRIALECLDTYLQKLSEHKKRADGVSKLMQENPDLGIEVPDYAALTWEAMRSKGEVGRDKIYSPRKDGCARVVPNVTMKVPTGGGKTFLAVQSLARILDKHFGAVTGSMVLWIVPSEAIYRQTKAALSNQDHPLRKLLNIASAGKLKILEKDTPLHKDDVQANLCIMLLMLPSANRQDAVNKLKLFKDRGNVNGFLPPEDDVPAHEKLVAEHQNLDYVKQADFLTGVETETVGMVRNSLGNILRLLRPLIVLDEGHKGFSDLAHKTLYGFNPRFVLELSATPKDGKDRHANWLVDIRGDALKAEEMIKMPIELKVTPGEMWRACLAEAWEKTESLQKKADELLANENRYIRPILLVQVERTGAEQREQGFIHALDVRDQLFQLGLSEEEVAIKTSETDDLRDQDLLSPSNRIRAIITKQALQEGWDCPFAYVLCSLAVSRSTNALTQLVGRILRQPHAKRTGMVPLDKCYVFTFREDTAKIIKLIRDGLAGEGMGDLAGQVYEAGGKSDSEKQSRQRRKEMRGREFFLPKVLVRCGTDRRELDWETDILSKLDWHAFTVADQAGSVPKSTSVDGGGVVLIDFKDTTQVSRIGGSLERFDVDYGVRVLTELIPNAWIAYRVQTQFLGALGEAGWSESEIASQQSYLRTCLDRLVRTKIDDLAEKAFDAGLLDGSIVFDLVAEPWWKMPVQEQITGTRRDVYDFEKNLFDPVYENELNNLERTVACYLDRQEMVWWWYRNVVKGQGYGLQGWKRNRIYPDFIVAKGTEEGIDAWVILETKGDHLDGSDTQYKAAVGAKLASAYRSNETAEVGQLRLFKASGREYKFAIVAEGQWERDVAAQFNKPTQC